MKSKLQLTEDSYDAFVQSKKAKNYELISSRLQKEAVADLLHAVLGYNSEVKELEDAVSMEEDSLNALEEAGDGLFFFTLAFNALGITLEEVVEKLEKWKPREPVWVGARVSDLLKSTIFGGRGLVGEVKKELESALMDDFITFWWDVEDAFCVRLATDEGVVCFKTSTGLEQTVRLAPDRSTSYADFSKKLLHLLQKTNKAKLEARYMSGFREEEFKVRKKEIEMEEILKAVKEWVAEYQSEDKV